MTRLLFFILIAGLLSAQSVKYTLSDKSERNQARFSSETPLEDVYGTADAVSGFAMADATDPAKTLAGEITVMVKSMKTGIDLRDEHLQSANWLDAEQYPHIKYVIKSVESLESKGDSKFAGKVNGEFTMHGKTSKVTAEIELTFIKGSEKTKALGAGDLLVVKANFEVKLSDYGVANDVVGSKVAENIKVEFSGVGTSG